MNKRNAAAGQRYPLFFEPVFFNKLWGGNNLASLFDYPDNGENTGECWGISAHPKGETIVKNGRLKGKSLSTLWKEEFTLFGMQTDQPFPLLVKLIDAKEDLSVQVHPGDFHEKDEFGKTECWYIVKARPGAEIVLGHHATDHSNLISAIEDGKWEQLLRRVPVSEGDFVYVPSGTVHAIGAGIVLIEIQQSSDCTYRLYDYDRLDERGNSRELHLKEALDVIKVPHQDETPEAVLRKEPGASIRLLVDNDYFSVYHYEVYKEVKLPPYPLFRMITILDGEGSLCTDGHDYLLHKGDHFLLPADCSDSYLSGMVNFIMAHP